MAKGNGGTRASKPAPNSEYGKGRILIDDGFPEYEKQAILAEFEKLEKEFGIEIPRIHLANQERLGMSDEEVQEIRDKIAVLEKKQADAMTKAAWDRYDREIYKLQCQIPARIGVHHDNDFITVGRQMYANAGMIADHEFAHVFRYMDTRNVPAWKKQLKFQEGLKYSGTQEQNRLARIERLKQKISFYENERRNNPAHAKIENLWREHGRKVSDYAGSNPAEFAAEVFAAYRKGDRRPFVVDAYNAVIKLPVLNGIRKKH